MLYRSRPVDSKQNGIHPNLETLLHRHTQKAYRRPVSESSRNLFTEVEARLREIKLPLILDSGCGTAMSTIILAEKHPRHLVVGVDKSAHRLAKSGFDADININGNCLLIRMNLIDFWRLALEHKWQLAYHYLLYPNPWPKPAQLTRRWHAHPVFPYLLGLGGLLEMRCNWRDYADEFQMALNYWQPGCSVLEEFYVKQALSLFEKKYTCSGHQLFRCRADLAKLDKLNQFFGLLQPNNPGLLAE
ncbi:MAG: SAM-dependent methyltransferase [Gammaproteobacteria bacterium]|nr:SAM-dependent methyltransferase [Gammaproteobacteria bacterium]